MLMAERFEFDFLFLSFVFVCLLSRGNRCNFPFAVHFFWSPFILCHVFLFRSSFSLAQRCADFFRFRIFLFCFLLIRIGCGCHHFLQAHTVRSKAKETQKIVHFLIWRLHQQSLMVFVRSSMRLLPPQNREHELNAIYAAQRNGDK